MFVGKSCSAAPAKNHFVREAKRLICLRLFLQEALPGSLLTHFLSFIMRRGKVCFDKAAEDATSSKDSSNRGFFFSLNVTRTCPLPGSSPTPCKNIYTRVYFLGTDIHLLIGYKAEGHTVDPLLYRPIRATPVARTFIFSHLKELVGSSHVKN